LGPMGTTAPSTWSRTAGLGKLHEVRERDLIKELYKWHPANKYMGFDLAILKKEEWLTSATPEVIERMAHTCLRLEVVCAQPTNEYCTKIKKRIGVAAVIRCTVCGEATQVWTELKAADFQRTTGFKIKGKPLDKPLCYLTLEDLMMADAFFTPELERGYQVMTWFREHVNSRQHRLR